MTPEFPIGTHVLIARVLEDLSPKGLCDVTVHLHADAVRIPAGADPCIWSAPVHDLVERIHRALLTSWSSQELSSPVAQADAAKRDRDLGGELGALMGGAASLQRQPWYPARVGDLVHIAYEAISDDLPASGATYQVRQDPDEPAGFLGLAELVPCDTDGGCWATSADPDPLFEMWMEAGAHRITIVRDGVVVHNGPADTRR